MGDSKYCCQRFRDYSRVIASVILKLSRYNKFKSQGLQDLLFASSFKSFGSVSDSAAFKCTCKLKIYLKFKVYVKDGMIGSK